MAVTGIALALVAGFAAVSSVAIPRTGPHVRAVATGPPVAAAPGSVGPPPAASDGLGGPVGPQAAELLVRVEAGSLPDGATQRLQVEGRVPSQYDWAAVDVLTGGVPIAAAGREVSADGTFSATLWVPNRPEFPGGLLVRLSAVGDGHLPAVPLATVVVAASLLDAGLPARRGYRLQ